MKIVRTNSNPFKDLEEPWLNIGDINGDGKDDFAKMPDPIPQKNRTYTNRQGDDEIRVQVMGYKKIDLKISQAEASFIHVKIPLAKGLFNPKSLDESCLQISLLQTGFRTKDLAFYDVIGREIRIGTQFLDRRTGLIVEVVSFTKNAVIAAVLPGNKNKEPKRLGRIKNPYNDNQNFSFNEDRFKETYGKLVATYDISLLDLSEPALAKELPLNNSTPF